MGHRNKLTGRIFEPHLQSTADVGLLFSTLRTTWEASDQCAMLKSILATAHVHNDISKIVAFALGPMSDDPPDKETLRSVFQHALMLTLRNFLSADKEGLSEIACYAQDPFYTNVDETVLDAHDIAILKDPVGFLEVDDSTAVICVSSDVPVKQIVSDLAQPALVIWNRIEQDDQRCERKSSFVALV